MSSIDFHCIYDGVTVGEAFRNGVQDAFYWHGHNGYTGTICEKPGSIVLDLGKKLSVDEAEEIANELNVSWQIPTPRLIELIANLAKDKQIDGISELRDESDREGIRVVIELKKDAMSEIVIELKNRNWTNQRIAKQLGMDEEEVLRLCQVSGLEHLFSDKDFSSAWVTEDDNNVFEVLTDEIPEEIVNSFRVGNVNDKNRIFHTYDKWECHKDGFYKSTKEGTYPGIRTAELWKTDKELDTLISSKIFSVLFDFNYASVEWNVSNHFQYIEPYNSDRDSAYNKGWVHKDHHAKFACMVYLTPKAELESGTSFYRQIKEDNKFHQTYVNDFNK
jgi:hypothetical protein